MSGEAPGRGGPAGPDDSAWPQRIRAFAVLAALVGLAVFLQSRGGFELDPRVIRDRIDALGAIAPLAFVAAAALRPVLLLPSWVLMSAGGLLFGVVGGVLYGSIGFTIGATISFSVARGLGRDAVAKRLHGRAASFDEALRKRGPLWLTLYTAIPVSPLTPVHAGAGLSGIPARVFLLAVAAGFLPRLTLFSVFGSSLNSAIDGQVAPAAGALVLLCATSALGLVVARRVAQRAEAQASDAARSPSDDADA